MVIIKVIIVVGLLCLLVLFYRGRYPDICPNCFRRFDRAYEPVFFTLDQRELKLCKKCNSKKIEKLRKGNILEYLHFEGWNQEQIEIMEMYLEY